MSAIGDRIKTERLRLGIKKQDEFAKIGGVNRTAQSNYERGNRNPDAQYLSRIAEAGADIQYIVTGIKSKPILLNELEGGVQELFNQSAQLGWLVRKEDVSFEMLVDFGVHVLASALDVAQEPTQDDNKIDESKVI